MDIFWGFLTFQNLAVILIGTLAGVLIGVLPGLSGPTGVAILLPLTFSMPPSTGLLLLGGVYMGSSYGGSVTAILLNAPGTEAAAATSLEGFPLMQQGRAKEGIFYALSASTIGGMCGVLTLLFFTPLLADVALRFGPAEMFLIALTGLAIIGSLSGNSLAKGLAAGAMGLLLSAVGMDIISGSARLTFGFFSLEGGIPLIPCLVGLFAVSEMIHQALATTKTRMSTMPQQNISFASVLAATLKKRSLLAKSSALGTLIGVMPGAGAAVASFVAYGEALRSSRMPEKFGTGCPDGIIAAESANNAAVGGSLVPLLALGVPGSTTCAILFGALTIHGLFPGPRLFAEHADVVYPFMGGMLLSVFAMLLIGRVGAAYFSKISLVPLKILIPVVLLFCFIGAYSIRYSSFDIVLTLVFGLVGVAYRLSDIPIAPTVLGLILGPICEEGFRQSLTIAGAEQISVLSYILFRPMTAVLLPLLLLVLYTSLRGSRTRRRRTAV